MFKCAFFFQLALLELELSVGSSQKQFSFQLTTLVAHGCKTLNAFFTGRVPVLFPSLGPEELLALYLNQGISMLEIPNRPLKAASPDF